MDQKDDGRKEKKDAMKKLRLDRKTFIEKAAARSKVQKTALKSIKTHLEKGAGTVPEVADATGMPTEEVLWYMAALKKYGEIGESGKDGGYFRYTLIERDRAGNA
ncbi:MAG: hypothetical protein JEZ11_07335 [Desulfobacterales bacterium]|nr:hypothetical protein [Desulfobacterales bacterium]